jgi:hypothetical protein
MNRKYSMKPWPAYSFASKDFQLIPAFENEPVTEYYFFSHKAGDKYIFLRMRSSLVADEI